MTHITSKGKAPLMKEWLKDCCCIINKKQRQHRIPDVSGWWGETLNCLTGKGFILFIFFWQVCISFVATGSCSAFMHRVQNANRSSAVDEWLEMLSATEWQTYLGMCYLIHTFLFCHTSAQGSWVTLTSKDTLLKSQWWWYGMVKHLEQASR